MADKNIGSLPTIPTLDDDSLMVVEQQGQAMKMTGAQFKDFGRQSVIGEVQGYVEAAAEAAESAQDAVSAVVDMTVEAHDLEQGQAATVEKSTKNGKVNLAFGLPRGAQGVPGPEGKTGPRGPKGETGSGLKILGYYGTVAELEAAQPSPQPGDAYGVGTEAPYDIYVFDGVSGQWKNNGPLTGGGGEILPENVVTSEGGGTVAVSQALGDAPWEMLITEEEEPPLTAGDIVYNEEQTVAQAIDGLFTSVSNGKALVASAITDKGVPTQPDATFAQMAGNIGQITTGTGTGDATATPGDILAPKTAYTASGKVTGIIPTLAAQTLTPGTADQTLAAGQYLGGRQTILGDPNLLPGNIRKGVTLFGVEGAVEQTFMATLTVTVDVGAVVTATLGDTQVSALCTTGQVTLELPAEGAWTVTAVRGVTQYNSVVVTVSASYAASLTAEVHLEYFGTVTPLSENRSAVGAVSTANYAVFAGGIYASTNAIQYDSKTVEAYDLDLSMIVLSDMSKERSFPAGALAGTTAIFAGRQYSAGYSATLIVEAYNRELEKVEVPSLTEAKKSIDGTSIGNYALFGGGYTQDGQSSIKSATVDAYDDNLAHNNPTPMGVAGPCVAASNQNYALLSNTSDSMHIAAYNAELTCSFPVDPEQIFKKAAQAGNYVVFAGGINDLANAYDLFLTRTRIQAPGNKTIVSALSLKDCAIFITESQIIMYDKFLTRTVKARTGNTYTDIGSASVADYALLAGGSSKHTSSGGTVSTLYHNTVAAYHYV